MFRLGPKEVDGSAAGTFDTGPGTALSRGAYRITSDVPLVAYQFNPLENANVFSNDASQLLPATALGAPSRYVVASWPQTIARSDVPAQDFGSDLRAFLTLVGTRPDTHVHLKTRAKVVPGGPLPSGLREGQDVDVVLQPFEVLNLETGSFGADFTGSVVEADEPVVVFTGSEASDAPTFSTLAARVCCADHLEEQVVPTRAVGTRYVLGHARTAPRGALAGAALASVEEPELFRSSRRRRAPPPSRRPCPRRRTASSWRRRDPTSRSRRSGTCSSPPTARCSSRPSRSGRRRRACRGASPAAIQASRCFRRSSSGAPTTSS